MAIIQVPDQYGYVLAAAVSTFFVGIWHGARVGTFRKAAKIPYPFEYASYEQCQTASSSSSSSSPATRSALMTFNAAQRAHQNFNENHVTLLGAMLITGLRFPVLAATLGAAWSVNRVVYAVGYTRSAEEGGKGRYYGAGALLAQYTLVLVSVKAVWDLVV
ncbi:membrane-associated proteins in eicosanoid and glutathione metabolism [Decorospora gaudefroyi]|uniref:Membrane-associated proteins in eicosanoid and glutathione metabolism n=1 Tax=Decorospora gaudefroyi TaxID=184978 RepID=A0A6A5KCZ2_9PLEO|nr:membrane-associated proteins in eicosanoid and glutathione metabolism [Decorospora gaudefroyi]